MTLTARILTLWDQGLSIPMICKDLGKPRTTVWTVLHRNRPGFKDQNRARRSVPAEVPCNPT